MPASAAKSQYIAVFTALQIRISKFKIQRTLILMLQRVDSHTRAAQRKPKEYIVAVS